MRRTRECSLASSSAASSSPSPSSPPGSWLDAVAASKTQPYARPFQRRHLFVLFYFLHLLLVIVAAVFSALHGFGAMFIGMSLGMGVANENRRLVRPGRVGRGRGDPDALSLPLHGPQALLGHPPPRQRRLPLLHPPRLLQGQPVLHTRAPRRRPMLGHLQYSPGQYVFLMVPGVNIFEWHPFSLSSSPHQDTVRSLADAKEGEKKLKKGACHL